METTGSSSRRLSELRSNRNAKLGALKEKLGAPSPNNQSDIDIRNKALHLLQQVDPQENAVSYAQQARSRESGNAPFQSYQNNAEALEREREANRRSYPSSYSGPSQGGGGDDLVDLLMPVVSCVSNACRVGISGIAQQAAQGVSMMTREAEDRIFATSNNSNNMQGNFDSVGIPSYQGSKYSDIPETTSAAGTTGGQKTGEHADILSC
ncbi:unnamed protein product [Cylindrotheca closterium]|uniref:Uncharacterized protein n=1 Tax=Cylindrotheca closterium TaxID=2856 RepID=A0AAD2JHE3_9STRA|nr:unnamed protein product [Cylindrotheca closterium]